jgi:hypothetical protein
MQILSRDNQLRFKEEEKKGKEDKETGVRSRERKEIKNGLE